MADGLAGGVALPRELKIACIDPHQTRFVGKGSDHLQLINFGRPAPPGLGEWGLRRDIFESALLQPARSVCVSLERFFIGDKDDGGGGDD